ncbi:MAG: nucleoside deaminase [Candidatus Gastranaerophilaceae bacterium]
MKFMREALKIAKQSGEDLPIGAVIMRDGKVLAKAHNKKEAKNDVTAHAEMLVIQSAQRKLKTSILDDCEIYITLEPCPMCAWAILNARIPKVYFGAYDTVYGSLGTAMDLRDYMKSKTDVVGGILEEECSQLLKDYFKEIRK